MIFVVSSFASPQWDKRFGFIFVARSASAAPGLVRDAGPLSPHLCTSHNSEDNFLERIGIWPMAFSVLHVNPYGETEWTRTVVCRRRRRLHTLAAHCMQHIFFIFVSLKMHWCCCSEPRVEFAAPSAERKWLPRKRNGCAVCRL